MRLGGCVMSEHDDWWDTGANRTQVMDRPVLTPVEPSHGRRFLTAAAVAVIAAAGSGWAIAGSMSMPVHRPVTVAPATTVPATDVPVGAHSNPTVTAPPHSSAQPVVRPHTAATSAPTMPASTVPPVTPAQFAVTGFTLTGTGPFTVHLAYTGRLVSPAPEVALWAATGGQAPEGPAGHMVSGPQPSSSVSAGQATWQFPSPQWGQFTGKTTISVQAVLYTPSGGGLAPSNPSNRSNTVTFTVAGG